MLTFNGRINRRRYWLGLVLLVTFSGFVRFALETSWAGEIWPILLLWVPVGAYLGFVLMVNRLHDMGESGWMSLLSLIPLFGFLYATLWLGLHDGDPKANQHGPVTGHSDNGDPDDEQPPEQTSWEWLEQEIRGQPPADQRLQADADAAQQTEIAPPDDGDKDDIGPRGETAQEHDRQEPAIRHQQDDVEREREQRREAIRRQQEEVERDKERRQEQIRRERAANAQHISEERHDEVAGPPPSGNDNVQMPEVQPTGPDREAPMSGTAQTRRSRRQLLLPLLFTFALLVAVVGTGILAYALLTPSSGTPTQEAVEPTPDLNATVEAAVASAIIQLTNSPPVPFDGRVVANPSTTTPDPAAQPTLEGSPNPDRLQEIECSFHCQGGSQSPLGYVEWVRNPSVSKQGTISIRAVIDNKSNFVNMRSPQCGFANISLTDDNNNLYGFIISRSMAIECGQKPGEWISNQYYYGLNILTVSAQIDPAAATHPGLALCLWTGGTTSEQNRLLDCSPVLQP